MSQQKHGHSNGGAAGGRTYHRRTFLGLAGGTALVSLSSEGTAFAAANAANLAVVAKAVSDMASTRSKLRALNSTYVPKNSADRSHGAFDTWPHSGVQWLQYEWEIPVATDRVDIYWWEDDWEVAMPLSYRVLYWNGNDFAPVTGAQGLGIEKDRFNTTAFQPVKTNKLRLEVVGRGKKSIGVLRWRVYSAGPVPSFAPVAVAGIDRSVIVGGLTHLAGSAEWLERSPRDAVAWKKVSGPGKVIFGDPNAVETVAGVTEPGDYVLQLAAKGKGGIASSKLRLRVEPEPPSKRLDVVYTTPYAISSPFWRQRAKALIVNWIPHCIAYCERTDLPDGKGGLDNFIEAAKALRGEAHGAHKGFVFSNAWVHQTIESICLALMVDPQGDAEIETAQAHMRSTLDRWIPIILAAQHPDGYLQTAFTLASRKDWPERWSPEHRGNHEGYVSGYFIESAINHYTLTGGKDLRLYNGAKKLADCWVAHIGPGKKEWFDGHQEMEQALVRFGRFVNDIEGKGRGNSYIALARFLLESRRGGMSYDQSHLPPTQQYEAVGHAVRAVYFYSGMADIAAETADRDYQSAVTSLWDNIVNRKYYVTGGIGSGDTSEGFGDDYALRHDGYCESCSSCGLIFFQYKMNLAYHDAKYADLYEETMYNALLGSVDLTGQHFTYTNPLIDTERYAWHNCPCCVGNIPRTLLMMPTWAYAKDADGIYINLFIGSSIDVGEVAGTRLQMVQETNYPWNGAVAVTVNPAEPRSFAIRVRVPNRVTSALYTATPTTGGLDRLLVNGVAVRLVIENGYAVIKREWKAGDRIEFILPLAVQQIVTDPVVEANRGQLALRYGPLIYSVETADQANINLPLGRGGLVSEWRPDLLGGVVAIKGQWADGSRLLAIPYFVRMNRQGPSPEFPTHRHKAAPDSKVWIASNV